MKAKMSGKWFSLAAANDSRPLVKHEPFPAPNDDTTTLMGMMKAAMPSTWLPQVLVVGLAGGWVGLGQREGWRVGSEEEVVGCTLLTSWPALCTASSSSQLLTTATASEVRISMGDMTVR